MAMMTKRPFGRMPDGTPVEEFTLRDGDCSCEILTYGGALRSLVVPDRDGKPVDILLGFDTLEDYRAQDKFMGALIGRYGNRIGGSRFVLEGKEYLLRANDGPNHLHGGPEGFDKQVWTVKAVSENALTLVLRSPDGQEGYPGTLDVTVTYTLRDRALSIDYRAASDRTTLCNLTNHAYFNLSGHDSGDIAGQEFQLLASRFVPVDGEAIPAGTIDPVEGTPMDLRRSQPLGEREYDHNWAIDGWDGTLRPAARVWSPATGISAWRLSIIRIPPTIPVSPAPSSPPGWFGRAGRCIVLGWRNGGSSRLRDSKKPLPVQLSVRALLILWTCCQREPLWTCLPPARGGCFSLLGVLSNCYQKKGKKLVESLIKPVYGRQKATFTRWGGGGLHDIQWHGMIHKTNI